MKANNVVFVHSIDTQRYGDALVHIYLYACINIMPICTHRLQSKTIRLDPWHRLEKSK